MKRRELISAVTAASVGAIALPSKETLAQGYNGHITTRLAVFPASGRFGQRITVKCHLEEFFSGRPVLALPVTPRLLFETYAQPLYTAYTDGNGDAVVTFFAGPYTILRPGVYQIAWEVPGNGVYTRPVVTNVSTVTITS